MVPKPPSRVARGVLVAAILPVGTSLFLSACGTTNATRDAPPVAQVDAGDLTGLDVDVHQAVGWGCCHEWADYVRAHGATVAAQDDPALRDTLLDLGVPVEAAACHVAEIDGYVVAGHVPAEAVSKLLAEQPDAVGLVVPGMPPISPGMGGDQEDWLALHVLLIDRNGGLVDYDF